MKSKHFYYKRDKRINSGQHNTATERHIRNNDGGSVHIIDLSKVNRSLLRYTLSRHSVSFGTSFLVDLRHKNVSGHFTSGLSTDHRAIEHRDFDVNYSRYITSKSCQRSCTC